MSDGGENVRRVQEYLHPFSEHLIDWFHITMRLTVLQQQTKALQEERPETGADVSKQLESAKHLLWHGNTEEALERLGDLLVELSLIQARSNAAKKVADGLSEFETYVCNNREFMPNFGERRRKGETISTAFVESTINQVVSRRFVKKQQMQWTLRGAHLCCRPGRESSTRIWTTYSAAGIQNSGRNPKRRSQSARRLDPRLFVALRFNGNAKTQRFISSLSNGTGKRKHEAGRELDGVPTNAMPILTDTR
jgi:hypothetical protein